MVISLENVSKNYDDQPILEPTTLSFLANVTSVLIGPSGCGKSTLLRLMVGLITPDTGKISFDGEVLNAENIDNLRRHKLGYVIQDGGLFPHLTAQKNITLLARFLNKDPKFIKERLEYLCDLVQLPPSILPSYPLHMSGGQRQRVSLMRALMLDPHYLFLDEPLGALDPITRNELQKQLKEIFFKLKKTVILVTHDMREAAFFGEDIILIKSGAVVQKGTFKELVQTPVEPYVEEFIHSQQFSLT